MPTKPDPLAVVKADASKAGAAIDAAVKPKVTVPIWVLLAVAAVANLVGVILHI